MNDHQKHFYGLLMEAGEKLRAFQLYEIGHGSGELPAGVGNNVITALVQIYDAQRKMEQAPPAPKGADRG